MSIYQTTKEYLIKNFDPNCHTCNFTDNHTQELNACILKIDPTYQAKKAEKIEEVRLAFVDFYIEVAKVSVFFRGLEKIIVKLTPYETHPDEHAFIERIGAYVQSIVTELDEINDNDEVLLISEHHLQTMYAMLKSISIPVDARQLIRRAIHDAFKLSDKDMILFLNKKVLIKFYCEEPQTSCERRFEGLPGDEIQSLVESLYSDNGENSLENDIEMVISTLTDTTLDFSKIDNYFYIAHHIRLIQNGLIDFMKTKISYPEIIIKGVAKYIFREAFYFIHEMLAEKLLELLARNNKNAEQFLKFFNGDVVIIEGKKVTTPQIIDDKGTEWSISALNTFVTKYTKEKNRLKQKEETFKGRLRERDELLQEKKMLQQDVQEFHQEIKKAQNDISKLKKGTSKLDRKELEDYLQNLEETLEAKEREIAALDEKIEIIEEKSIREKELLLEVNEGFKRMAENYDLLIVAISKVLMAR